MFNVRIRVEKSRYFSEKRFSLGRFLSHPLRYNRGMNDRNMPTMNARRVRGQSPNLRRCSAHHQPRVTSREIPFSNFLGGVKPFVIDSLGWLALAALWLFFYFLL